MNKIMKTYGLLKVLYCQYTQAYKYNQHPTHRLTETGQNVICYTQLDYDSLQIGSYWPTD